MFIQKKQIVLKCSTKSNFRNTSKQCIFRMLTTNKYNDVFNVICDKKAQQIVNANNIKVFVPLYNMLFHSLGILNKY